jgi:hypothetical protein
MTFAALAGAGSGVGTKNDVVYARVDPVTIAKASTQRLPVPSLPDLRFEQAFLLSIKPFITPYNRTPLPGQSLVGELQQEVAMASVPRKDLFSGEVSVQWKSVLWIILRDQVSLSLWHWAEFIL